VGSLHRPQLPVLLIDEIDKADIEFPNDLLQELDRMSFDVYETRERIAAKERPIVVITSNNEKELPDAFLRRCFFHYIKFPDRETMQAIIDVHFPGIQKTLVSKAMDVFYELREVPGLKKKPSTSELLDWLKLLLNEDMPLDVLQNKDPTKAIPPLHGALLKNEQDVMLFERAWPSWPADRACWCRDCQYIASVDRPRSTCCFRRRQSTIRRQPVTDPARNGGRQRQHGRARVLPAMRIADVQPHRRLPSRPCRCGMRAGTLDDPELMAPMARSG
jgi:hypothetical protein